MRKIAAALLLVLSLTTISKASDIVLYSSSVVNKVITAATNVDLDLNFNHVDALSAQINYSSASTSPISFTDGNTSTMTLRVTTNGALSAAKASEKITIVSNTAMTGAWLQVIAGGRTVILTEGRDWTRQAVSSNTARSLQAALNRNFSDLFTSTVPGTSSIIYSTAVVAGADANSYSVKSSTVASLLVNTPTFISGQDAAYINIGSARLVADTDWVVASVASNTAVNIKNAISKSPVGPIVVVSTTAGGTVISATTTVVGSWTNFTLVSSTPTALTFSGPAMARGSNSDIIYNYLPSQNSGFFSNGFPTQSGATVNSISKPNSLGVGSAMLLGKTAGTYPSPLVDKTTYYALAVTATNFQLSDTSTGALAGLPLVFSTSTVNGGGAFTLTPLALTGTPSFKLQASNDGVNFQDVYVSTSTLLPPFQANISFASPYASGSVIYNGDVYYKILRLAYTAATTGATNLQYIINGKRFAN